MKTRYTQVEENQFRIYFNAELEDYWDKLTGFDVVRFDEEVIRPAYNQSTHDAVESQLNTRGFNGQNGVAFVYRLIGVSR